MNPAAVLAFTLNILLVITAVCLIALIMVRCLFPRSPTIRYYVCLTGLLCILLSPLVVGIQSKAGFGLVNLPLPRNLLEEPARVTELSADDARAEASAM